MVVKMDGDLYLVSPKLKALIRIGNKIICSFEQKSKSFEKSHFFQIKGEARKAISKIWKDDPESYVISKQDTEHWRLEKLGYAVLDCW
jgi:hypothetical protein